MGKNNDPITHSLMESVRGMRKADQERMDEVTELNEASMDKEVDKFLAFLAGMADNRKMPKDLADRLRDRMEKFRKVMK